MTRRHDVLASTATTAIGYAMNHAVEWVRRELSERRSWRITVTGDDDLYLPVHRWLTEHSEPGQRRALTARTVWTAPERFRPPLPALQLLLDGQIAQRFTLNGHRVTARIDCGDGAGSGRDAGKADSPGPRAVRSDMDLLSPPRIVFESSTRAGRDAVEEVLRQLDAARADEKRQPSLMVAGQWGNWERRSDLPARSMESVIVGGGVLDELHADLRDFRDREDEYVRRGIPYHRAYLLTGPPGTGKTSAVKAVTNALRMDLWYAQLSALDQDTKLISVLGEVRPHGVLLLEDIDSLAAAVDRTAGHAARDVTTSGLLNALDGVATPHGLVTIMTTNHPERLDPALSRPGRVDRTLEFGLPDSATIARHFEFFYGQPPRAPLGFAEGRSSAEISEIMKRHMDDPAGAELALRFPVRLGATA